MTGKRNGKAKRIRLGEYIAGLLLTTECLITEIPEKKKEAPGGHGPHGGGGMDMDY